MFDADMQKEYVFCSYLLRLLPTESTQMIDLEGALRLEFYKLEQTFKGEIILANQSGVYELPVNISSADTDVYFRVEQQLPETISVTVYSATQS